MPQDLAFQKRIQRIGEIVEQLESTADPNARAMAKEFLELLMALHGTAIERILEISSEFGETGRQILQQCGHDELVGSVLLLYSLHPDNIRTRVIYALEKARPNLESHGASAELISVSEDGTVKVHLRHKSGGGCGSSSALMKSTLEAALENAAPDAPSILIEETGGETAATFISVAQLEGASPMTASYTATPQRSAELI